MLGIGFEQGDQVVPAPSSLQEPAQLLFRPLVGEVHLRQILPSLDGRVGIAKLSLAQSRQLPKPIASHFVAQVLDVAGLTQQIAQLGIFSPLPIVALEKRHCIFVRGIERQDLGVLLRRLGLSRLARQGTRLVEERHDPLFRRRVCGGRQRIEQRIVPEPCLSQPVDEFTRRGGHGTAVIGFDIPRRSLRDFSIPAELLAVVHRQLDGAIVGRFDLQGTRSVRKAMLSGKLLGKLDEQLGRFAPFRVRNALPRLHAFERHRGQHLLQGRIVAPLEASRLAQRLGSTRPIASAMSDRRLVLE